MFAGLLGRRRRRATPAIVRAVVPARRRADKNGSGGGTGCPSPEPLSLRSPCCASPRNVGTWPCCVATAPSASEPRRLGADGAPVGPVASPSSPSLLAQATAVGGAGSPVPAIQAPGPRPCHEDVRPDLPPVVADLHVHPDGHAGRQRGL